MGSGFCNQCNKQCALIEDEGETCCMECGNIVSVNRSVETVEFTESGGGFQVVGTRVDQYGASYGRASMHTAVGYSRASAEITVNKARVNIEEVVYNLKMPQQIVKNGTRLYKLALMANFTRGRRTNNSIAAVVYATCRMFTPRPLPYMLIDFADYFRVNVFELGHTFLRLSEVLSLKLPLIDPSIYVPRFARDLNLGGKQNKVAQCAVRIVARMKRDWIVTGRRPAGISGAGLLIACRLYGFKRTLEEVSLLVHLSTSTIRKRLSEFRDTAACQMTSLEFEAILDFDDIEASDPPCFTRSRKEAEKLRNQPALTVEEIETKVLEAMGVLSEEELEAITSSQLAPPNKRKLETKEDSESSTQPQEKRQRLSSMSRPTPKPQPQVDEEDEEYGGLDDEDEDDDAIYGEPESSPPRTQLYEGDGEDGDVVEVKPVVEDFESLSDLDDDEIDGMINDEHEVRLNEMIWRNMYSEWEEQQCAKDGMSPAERTLQASKKKTKKEKPDSAAAAVTSVLERRMVSSKINQDAINALLQASADTAVRARNPLLDLDFKLPGSAGTTNE